MNIELDFVQDARIEQVLGGLRAGRQRHQEQEDQNDRKPHRHIENCKRAMPNQKRVRPSRGLRSASLIVSRMLLA